MGRLSGAVEPAQVLVPLLPETGGDARGVQQPPPAHPPPQLDAVFTGQRKWRRIMRHQVCHRRTEPSQKIQEGVHLLKPSSLPFSHAVKLPRCLSVIFWLFPVPTNYSTWHAGSLAAGQFFQLFVLKALKSNILSAEVSN